MPPAAEERVRRELRKLVGLELAATARAAGMRGFHFGELRPCRGRAVGGFALHVQCAWRVEGPGGALTGRSDLWEPVEDLWGDAFERRGRERDGNLQGKRVAGWLGHRDPRAGACLGVGNPPVVLAARATPCGGAEIDPSGGCRLALFPAGGAGGDWRLFRPGEGDEEDAPRFGVAGGRIEEDE